MGLFPSPIHPFSDTPCSHSSSLEVKPGQLPPPGLNRQLITRLTGGATPSPDQLEERKLAVVRLLSAEVLSSEEVVCPLIVASGDPKSRSG